MPEVELIPCPACGNQVSNQAPMCPRCGHPISPVPIEDTTEWETCQVEFAGGNRRPYQFLAEVYSPAGTHLGAVSSVFTAGPSERRNLMRRGGVIDLNPQPDDPNASQAHEEIVNSLLHKGWESLPDRGEYWWQKRFRRKWNRFNNPGDTSISPRDEYIIVGDDPEHGEYVLIPEGSRATLLEVGTEPIWWAKIRTETGIAGFITEETDKRTSELSSSRIALSPEVTAAQATGCLGLVAVPLLFLIFAILLS